MEATHLGSGAGFRLVKLLSLTLRSCLEQLSLTISTGLSFLVQFRSSVSADDCLKFCNNTFVRICKTRKNPYTIEATVAGQRIIFTADPENVKTILATQFWNFEKGEKFRNDWIDMLGHSMLKLRQFLCVESISLLSLLNS